ncbi:MAG: hypothetical protein ABEK50_04690 [bacterium]
MPDPTEPPREPDSLAGSPELFATNLLLVRAIENQIDRIEITRSSSEITVQLLKDEHEYEQETLTETTSSWSDIVDRFKEQTTFEDDDSGELKPSIPAAETIRQISVTYEDTKITLTFDY